MARWILNLHLFDGDGAGAAPAGGGEAGEAAVVPGVLEDGTKVDNRLAARMKDQAQKRRARGEAPVSVPAKQDATQPVEEPQPAEPSLEERWDQLKKGEMKELYGKDVQAAIQERFKNQKDASEQLKQSEEIFSLLRQKAGVETNDELFAMIRNDDSLYEEAAEEAGMTVDAYKQFKALQDEHDARKAQEEQDAEQLMFRQHIEGLVRQAEEFKKTFPDFDLNKEMQNETFRRLTAPNSGLKLEDAYYAVHHRELAPQTMAYAVQRTKQQISQSLQANSRRPSEGAMQGSQAFNVSIDPRSMTREQREQLKQRARRGERIEF